MSGKARPDVSGKAFIVENPRIPVKECAVSPLRFSAEEYAIQCFSGDVAAASPQHFWEPRYHISTAKQQYAWVRVLLNRFGADDLEGKCYESGTHRPSSDRA